MCANIATMCGCSTVFLVLILLTVYQSLVSAAVLDGMQAELKAAGVDLGAVVEPVATETAQG